jgi:hypothetical protein
MPTKEDDTKILDAPENPSNVILKDPKSSEIRAVDPLLARLEGAASFSAADKKEGFLQDHISDLPTPEHKGLSLENAVALSGLMHENVEYGNIEYKNQLQDMAVGILQLIEDFPTTDKRISAVV